MIMGGSVEGFSDLAVVSITLIMVRSVMLTSTMNMMVLQDQSRLTLAFIAVRRARSMDIPKDVWCVFPPILSAAVPVGAIWITSSFRPIMFIPATIVLTIWRFPVPPSPPT